MENKNTYDGTTVEIEIHNVDDLSDEQMNEHVLFCFPLLCVCVCVFQLDCDSTE